MLKTEIKRFRLERGFTQTDMAKILEVSQNTVSQYETGKRMPPVKKLTAIAKVIGCSLDDMCSTDDLKG